MVVFDAFLSLVHLKKQKVKEIIKCAYVVLSHIQKFDKTHTAVTAV